MIFDPFRY